MQKHNFLFSGDVRNDVITLSIYINSLAVKLGLSQLDINTTALFSVVVGMVKDFPHQIGADKSSPFKKAAAFTANFVAERPILNPFPVFGDLASHQNAIVAFAIATDALEGATLHTNDGDKILKNRIRVSKHFYQDLISCLSSITPSNHFNCLALLYESLAYQANPEVSYKQVI